MIQQAAYASLSALRNQRFIQQTSTVESRRKVTSHLKTSMNSPLCLQNRAGKISKLTNLQVHM